MLKNVPISLCGPVMNIKLALKLRYSKQHWEASMAGNIFYTINYRRTSYDIH